ncbi:MAG: ShlB/FhaC/HecB family hemolysin secretion/activation protein [Alphaproteobacteria bacterium]|nr:ShlB/FhaC/HecB family hemolysin secretion/activation protein [Alphaproteobacteria bacterium]
MERRVPQPGPPPAAAPPRVPETPAAPAETAGTPEFVLLGVVVRGSSVFDAASLIDVYESMLARRVGPRELDAIGAEIVERYRRAGFAFVTAYAPPQRGDGGIAVIQVVEGHVERVDIDDGGNGAEAAALARAMSAALLAERPTRLATLERSLLLIGDLPGVELGRPRLRPIDLAAGSYALVLPLRVRRLEAAMALDNRGSRDYGPLQLWTSGQANAIDGTAAWAAQGGIFTAPASPREILYGQAALMRSLGTDGLQLRAQASGSRNVAGGALADVDARTESARLTVNLSYPFLRARRLSLWGAVSADALRIAEDRSHRRFFIDELRVLRATLSGVHVEADGASTWFAAQGSLGLDVAGASATGALRSRPSADARFAKLRVDATRMQPLSGPWSLELRAGGQLADDAVFSAEEFDLGGARFGRAFEPGALSGDRAIAGGLELRYADPIRLPAIEQTELFAFADGGIAWITAGGTRVRDHLSSAGIGLRARVDTTWRAAVELGHPLDSSVRKLREQGPRIYFSVAAEF